MIRKGQRNQRRAKLDRTPFILRFDLECIDTIEAKEIAKKIYGVVINDPEVKKCFKDVRLQVVVPMKPSVGIRFLPTEE